MVEEAINNDLVLKSESYSAVDCIKEQDNNMSFEKEELNKTSSSCSFNTIDTNNVTRRFPPNQFLKFSTLTLIPGKPRKWKKVLRRTGSTSGAAWLYRWEYIPESIDNVFMENLELVARGIIGPRRTGRTTRAVSFQLRETSGSNISTMYHESDGSFDYTNQSYLANSTDMKVSL
ncbi:uncharacterized protein CMU_001490 [Cryptosporidium muris RN66]|uniref:Uncharacterized protein n=1 Tax=Cryptosporidium muris (strain RN66) TaxID=441375 RepID=B6AGD7_CRYMR|nr:uncharacterized protein CMU_001490 [Cryptosporidium muris RN66]EEA07278.1 hypothetical protein, conserved [Cryptosporidium muris RN66]|eukprot:XP_002141627.1 hypothetical protein [Cryptosporidium muris RN66]